MPSHRSSARHTVLPSALAWIFHSFQPNSLTDVFTAKGQTKSTKHPALQPFATVLASYWNTGGKRLKAYRDFLEHHALVATEAYLARSDAGITLLHILLPNNPEVKSHAKLVYDPPQHALPYIEQAFTALVRFADSMTQRLLSTPLDPQAYVIAPNRYAFKAPRLFQPIPSLAELSARIKQSAQA